MLLHTSTPLPSASSPHPYRQGTNESAPALLGQSALVRRLRTQIGRIAPYLRTALIVGEPGCGKSQIARALHDAGPQANGPFVACSAVTFAEALFGERSAEDAASLLDSARGGTLYLRGVDELAYPLQGTLQRFLAGRESTRMGLPVAGRAAQPHREAAEVRIIAGSRRDLRTLSSVGQFRTELYGKLSALELRVPALRERTEDIGEIAGALLEHTSLRTGSGRRVLAASALEALKTREWAGNLRELEHALEDGAAQAPGAVVEAEHLPPPGSSVEGAAHAASPSKMPADERLDIVVQRHVLQVLTRCRGNKLRAAELLGLSRSTLYRMLDSGTFAAQAQGRAE